MFRETFDDIYKMFCVTWDMIVRESGSQRVEVIPFNKITHWAAKWNHADTVMPSAEGDAVSDNWRWGDAP